MNKREALRQFCEYLLPILDAKYGKNDIPARCEAWNDYTDMLCKDGEITLKQYESWANPFG